ncbi:MAG: hypothetical protein NC429_05465 [Lachnospiraceae bacterium]|nr:hypothetical protein [Lachnospiraceae bacterium]
MQHKKIIQEILGKELEKEGFAYVPGETSVWTAPNHHAVYLVPLADVILTWSGKRNDILEDKYMTVQIHIENQKMYDEYRAQKRKKK